MGRAPLVGNLAVEGAAKGVGEPPSPRYWGPNSVPPTGVRTRHARRPDRPHRRPGDTRGEAGRPASATWFGSAEAEGTS
jgi:hypothetical protein